MEQVLRSPALLGRLLLAVAIALAPMAPASADLRSAPAWYDQNAVATTPDWHYRVPISVPAGSTINSTVKVDVDFASLLSAMGVTGTFDVNSPRVVRSTGALSTIQEYTDTVYAGGTDATGNSRGEVRFILEDAGTVTYYLYFDVTQNGTKPANPQTPINGNFERGATGTAQPLGWNAPTVAAVTPAVDAQVRPSETYTTSTTPVPLDSPTTRTTDGSPNSGSFSYLYGNRTVGGAAAAAGAATNPGVTFTRTITVPASNPGSITFKYRPEGWDSDGFDFTRIDLTNAAGTTVLVEMVGPTAGSFSTKPWSANLGSAQASNTSPGYRHYNGFDCDLTGVHRGTPAMTGTACNSEPWWTITQSLAAYAGQTIQLRFRFFSDAADKTWFHIDDVEWSVVTATLGTPQGFGINIATPATGSNYVPGQTIPVTVQVDANPTAATTPVTVWLFDNAGTAIAGPFTLFNDGSHGDATAGDAIWSNNGSVTADAIIVPLSAPTASNYVLRAFGRDATTSSIGAQNGLIRGPGTGAATETQANFWNIDEILFNVQTAAITFAKTSSVVSDPQNGTTNPKLIPGATVRYCLLVANNGPATATNIIATDTLPTQTTYIPGSMKSGTSCAGAATVEDDDNAGADESDPFGASYSGGTLITITTTLVNAAVMALTFDVTIN